ncbi:MAG: MFS transporter [Myxococcota bacterium]
MAATSPPSRSERATVLLIAGVQFVNILDFMMVMPLGPDFALALGIPQSRLGLIGGSYTAAAALSGVIGSLFFDRFDRKRALTLTLLGLVVGTTAGGFAQGLVSLLAARLFAGFFGGPATSLSMAIIADLVPSERRGRAMGAVMTAFSVASVLGVPAGLFLAELSSWRMPFFAVASLGLVMAVLAARLLPPLRSHLHGHADVGEVASLWRPLVLASFSMTAVVMMAGFIVIPNISAFVQSNLGYPREDLKWLYFAGGVFSFASLRVAGQLVDRAGSTLVGLFSSVLLVAVMFVFFYRPSGLPVMFLFTLFMVSMSSRNVAYNTLTSKVPGPRERARFQSLQSATQHLASATGAFFSAQLLREVPKLGSSGEALVGTSGKVLTELSGMKTVALVSMALSVVVPMLLGWVEAGVKKEHAETFGLPG